MTGDAGSGNLLSITLAPLTRACAAKAEPYNAFGSHKFKCTVTVLSENVSNRGQGAYYTAGWGGYEAVFWLP